MPKSEFLFDDAFMNQRDNIVKATRAGWAFVILTLTLVGIGVWLGSLEVRGHFPMATAYEVFAGAVIAVLFSHYFEVLRQPDLEISLWEEGRPLGTLLVSLPVSSTCRL